MRLDCASTKKTTNKSLSDDTGKLKQKPVKFSTNGVTKTCDDSLTVCCVGQPRANGVSVAVLPSYEDDTYTKYAPCPSWLPDDTLLDAFERTFDEQISALRDSMYFTTDSGGQLDSQWLDQSDQILHPTSADLLCGHEHSFLRLYPGFSDRQDGDVATTCRYNLSNNGMLDVDLTRLADQETDCLQSQSRTNFLSATGNVSHGCTSPTTSKQQRQIPSCEQNLTNGNSSSHTSVPSQQETNQSNATTDLLGNASTCADQPILDDVTVIFRRRRSHDTASSASVEDDKNFSGAAVACITPSEQQTAGGTPPIADSAVLDSTAKADVSALGGQSCVRRRERAPGTARVRFRDSAIETTFYYDDPELANCPMVRSASRTSTGSRENPFVPDGALSKEVNDLISHMQVVRLQNARIRVLFLDAPPTELETDADCGDDADVDADIDADADDLKGFHCEGAASDCRLDRDISTDELNQTQTVSQSASFSFPSELPQPATVATPPFSPELPQSQVVSSTESKPRSSTVLPANTACPTQRRSNGAVKHCCVTM